jgi:eukaryotic-like serine/threonine-protein kinase
VNQPIRKHSTRVTSRQTLVDLVEAAIRGELAVVTFDEPPGSQARCPIELMGPGLDAPIPLIAQIAGAETGGAHPVILMPSPAAPVAFLESLVRRLRAGTSGTIAMSVSPNTTTEPAPGTPNTTTEPAPGTPNTTTDPASISPPRVSHTTLSAPLVDRALDEAPELLVEVAPGEAPDPLVGAHIGGGRYQVEALIGAGGMGRVYVGKQVALARPVAIKVLDGRFRSDAVFAGRFHREALAASRLDHPNVTRVLDFGQDPTAGLYLVMDLLQGRPLSEVIYEDAPIDLPRIVAIMSQVCTALGLAHERGVVHRDVKPDNIIVETRSDDERQPFEHVLVCDFGLASLLPSDSRGGATETERRRLTGVDEIMGTPDYMAPEQCRGGSVDLRSDVYACGVMLFEMATGRVPFNSTAPMEVIGMHLMTPPPRPTSLNRQMDPRLEPIVLRALEKDPNRRYASMRELRDELRALVFPTRIGTGTPPSRPTPEGIPAEVPSSPRPSSTAHRRLDGLARELDFGDATDSLRPSLIPLADGRAAEPLPDREARASTPPRRVDPHVLLPDARALLWGKSSDRRAAITRLIDAGVSGYWALLRARSERVLSAEPRRIWIQAVRELAKRGLAALGDSLSRIDLTAQGPTLALCEDLLTAIPERREPAWVDQVERFADHPRPAIRRATLGARIRMGGHGLAEALLAALADPDPDVQRLATRAYQRQGSIGAVPVQALVKLMESQKAPDEVRASAALALARVDRRCQDRAELALLEAVQGRSPSFIRLFGARPPGDGPLFLEAAARALLHLSGPEVRSVIEKRAHASKGELRARLERLLAEQS